MSTFGILVIIVGLNALATIALWREAARKPPTIKKKIIANLLESEPLAPKHEPPKAPGEKYPSLVSEVDHRFFLDFADFANVVNWWLAGPHVGSPWRLQELPDAILKLRDWDSPMHGRRYDIFHNQFRVGTLEVSPGPSPEYSGEKPNVFTDLRLGYVRLLTFDTVQSFLHDIAFHVTENDPNTREYFETRQRVDCALTKVLWESQSISEFPDLDGQSWGDLELGLNGSAAKYFLRRQALRDKQQSAA